jgi:RNA polymerase sigma-70 factor, ECF subfamily
MTEATLTARRFFEAGRSAWPSLPLSFEAFEAFFAPHAAAPTPPLETHAADVYLACACALGVPGALPAFERAYSGDLARAVGSIDPRPAAIDDVLQTTRERLFVRVGDAPGKIVTYGGRASLRSWLTAIAVRDAISRKRRKGEQRHDELTPAGDRRLVQGGPELEYLHRRYKLACEEAVRDAVERLPSKQRMLLRLNLVDGVSIDKLATMYKAGRATVARWLVAARSALVEEARGEMRTKLGLTASELDGLGPDLQSQLEVSILRLLGDKGAESP